MTKDKDPAEGLEDDASKGLEIEDPVAREADQLKYYGGDPDPDTEDLSKLDRGDNAEPADEDEDRGDDVSEDGDEAESEEESEGDEEGEEESEDEGPEGDDEDDEAEEDDAESGDQEDSESDEDGPEDDESTDDVEDEDEGEPKSTGIPRHRFNEVNQRMRDAEAEIARRDSLKDAKEESAEDKFDFDAAEDTYMELLLDGKTKEAGEKRREIRTAEMEVFKAESVEETTTAVDERAMEKTLGSLSKEAEALFPTFDPKHDSFNPDAVEKVLTFMRGYELRGMPSDDAFVSALADAMEIYDLVTDSEEQSDEDTPKGKVVTKKKGIKKVKQKIAAAKQQGKSPAGEGDGSTERGAVAPNIEDMTDEEMDALPPGTLERLRGDLL